MNLSPGWVERLAHHGFEAVHWSTIGAATAPDVEILKWANEHQFVVITNDLDFSLSSLRAVTPRQASCKIQSQDLLSNAVVGLVANVLKAHQADIDPGALVSIDEAGPRVRMLPLRGPQETS